MTATTPLRASSNISWPTSGSLAWPAAALALLVALQCALIFGKSFNWDEFQHYSMVYELRNGTLSQPFQTLLARLLSWTSYASDDLITQMMTARLAVWGAFLIGLCSLYGLARQFVSATDAAWTTLVYLGAGTVFAHGFAIRTDPIAMALLMSALYLLASRRTGWLMVLAVGALVGFAGALTVKAIFYAPCFAGIAWLRLCNVNDKRPVLIWLAAIIPVAAASFIAVHVLHRADLAPVADANNGASFIANGMKWLTEGLFRQPEYILLAFLTAPVFVYALVMSPSVWRATNLTSGRKIALIGFCLPLVVILFYRNMFPYFFVFLFAPVAVALAPAIASLRVRYGPLLLAVAICIVPLGKSVSEPREVIINQRAIIDYVHQQFPGGAVSLDHSGMVANYPRVINHLVSGIGLANYNASGIPLVAQAVERGGLDFVINNKEAISHGLAGQVMPGELLPADVAALHGNYVRVWGPLWLAGEVIPAGTNAVAIDIPNRDAYIADGNVTINGANYLRGEIVELDAGQHYVSGGKSQAVTLWRGTRLPAPPPSLAEEGSLFTNF